MRFGECWAFQPNLRATSYELFNYAYKALAYQTDKESEVVYEAVAVDTLVVVGDAIVENDISGNANGA